MRIVAVEMSASGKCGAGRSRRCAILFVGRETETGVI